MIDKLYTIKVIFNQYRCIKIVPRKEKLGINFSLQINKTSVALQILV